MNREPRYTTIEEIIRCGPEELERGAAPHCRLIYSSPGTLFYNSPGAYGFGVKRAGLLLPESVMLLVAPGCCGSNSTVEGSKTGYGGRMYYLQMSETDLVTGRHLDKIPTAAAVICETHKPRPQALLICITCVDALLGTDLERVCRKAAAACGIPVVPCYMYAINREGKKPPMIAIRQALYSLLRPAAAAGNAVNLLGNFSPLDDGGELPALLRQAGFDRTNQLAACRTFAEYLEMGGARLNLVLNPEARLAAEDLRRRLGTPYVELARLYQLDKIQKQYALFGAALHAELDDRTYYAPAADALEDFRAAHRGLRFAVGQMLNANAFELSLALVRYGFAVPVIFANAAADDFPYLQALNQLSPGTRVYSSLDPSMINFDRDTSGVDVALGPDAGYYLPRVRNVPWNRERQPFGYRGLTALRGEVTAVRHQPENWRQDAPVLAVEGRGRR